MNRRQQAQANATTFPDISPVTGNALNEFPAMTPSQALDIAQAAAVAQPNWAALPYSERRRILLAAADDLEAHLGDHVQTLALEIGATRPWAEMNVHEAAATLREAAALTSSPIGELLPSSDPNVVNHSLRIPAGVTLSIVPRNAPVILSARSSAISLAVGNAVVIRPSEESPIAAGMILADALHRAGVPKDVVSVVTTRPGDGRQVITALIQSPHIRRVAFIGSTPVGRAIAAQAGAALTPAIMELGGKNATVVRHDADLERWTPALAFSSFVNSGQVCMCTDRILVHRSRFDETVERLTTIADSMMVGDPRDPATDIGPVINDSAARRFAELITDARSAGATVMAGGDIDGRHARPTILTEVPTACRFATEEGFLPIVEVLPFDSDDQAVELANSLEEGLIASVMSADRDQAYAVAQRLRTGAVHVNGPSVGDEPHVPFGGIGASGMGRLGGTESLHFYTEQRSLYVH
ncbi:aldehyde dehydrogenase family protein [Kribbella qitaiheensis]|uniref:Aldehyde dehydrogenase family protein n=1 Tax=Kribbella qitaiheensis TaxID=1544730 RepID=A0A7G6X530_9ACTN|nr:aldehyde dehydrogenase family protein [Kribbella qitaiheensis]QNE21345.1 aldehyde dehydrogenase family protein [Kribbella qitaiheensis]